MTHVIKYFGQIAEICKKEEEEIVNQKSIPDLTEFLIQKYPELSKLTFKIAVDQKIASEETPILEGSELALLPPFAGG